MNILVATNSTYMHPTMVLLCSLCENHKEETIDLYVGYRDLTEDDFSKIRALFSKYNNKFLHEIRIKDELLPKVDVLDRFGYEALFRIMAIDDLPESVERILYLDCDMVINGSLNEVYGYEFGEECPFVVCEDYVNNRTDNFERVKKRAGIPQKYKSFNSGFMLMNIKYLRERRSTGYIIDAFAREYLQYEYHDQDILNHMYYDKVEYVPWEKYNMPPGHWWLDTIALANHEIKYATYPEVQQQVDTGTKRFLNVTEDLLKSSVVIHYMWILKPWVYSVEDTPWDLGPFFDIWRRYERILELLQIGV